MIRITIERAYPERPARTIVKEFADVADASNWMVQDSYFDQSYTAKLTWERIEPAEAEPTHPFTNTRGEAFINPRGESLCTGYRPGPDGLFVVCLGRAGDPIHAVPAPQVTRVFTFGSGHRHPVTGRSLAGRFVEITAESIDHCRAVMLNHFGHNWSHDYRSREAAGVSGYGLTKLPKEDWPPTTGRWIVDATGLHQPGV